MPMKIKSEQLRTEHYDYMTVDGENIFYPIKARPGEVIVVHSVCIYNRSGANSGVCYKMMRVKGHECRLNYTAAINNGVVQRWATDVYLKDGDECGVAITPDQAGGMYCVNFQILRFKDEEYDKPT